MRLAERSGFGFVGTILGERRVAIEAERREIAFFIVHYRLSDTTMESIIRLLRGSDESTIRYAPIILVIDDCPFETILKYVQFGYDDIITLPEKREIIVDRLLKQLNSEQIYIETEDYLGPDRRRMELGPVAGETRRVGTIAHSRLLIERTLEHGVRVVRRQFIGLNARPQAAAGQSSARPGAVRGHA